MAMLVTRQQAADHLRIDDPTDEADDIDSKIMAASAAILSYLEMTSDDVLTSDSDYPEDDFHLIQAAVLLLVGDLYRHRDSESPAYTGATLSGTIRALLYPLKTWGLV